ncbi:trihelix transcription factor ASIL1-like [Impatiens glandulifera]|uniref:trihelix transcription factor ASIL1-like n=1 Tax=Impatiens glandulifera TaxID=253017 RepID=UPI001FB08B26|nr:trihelix transcription factor ASIL1-like [Impatiens glandulifera]
MAEEFTDSPLLLKPSPSQRTVPFREDCWSEEATSTLVDAWGRRFMELNRGNLRQNDWQEVSDIVNSLHGHTKKSYRTDVQCKNRIDTLKKKYKVEKARVSASNGAVTSSWSFYSRMDTLIGSAVSNKTGHGSKPVKSPPMGIPLTYRKPVTPINQVAVLPQKRPLDDSYFRKNYSAMAAAAAAVDGVEEEESEDEASSQDFGSSEQSGEGDRDGEAEGMRSLARAIVSFGEIYERVEREKQRQMIELEKQRMQFTKDLEVQRMQLFMDTQVEVVKMKQVKRSNSNDIYS